jgi:hypothetical protein
LWGNSSPASDLITSHRRLNWTSEPLSLPSDDMSSFDGHFDDDEDASYCTHNPLFIDGAVNFSTIEMTPENMKRKKKRLFGHAKTPKKALVPDSLNHLSSLPTSDSPTSPPTSLLLASKANSSFRVLV